ncbi:hypothetical protein [Chondrinema litorale]|uniref:hypothetical protein n=1 Tax=Chondrinema litorale TaxID=2994555 RepID=UPI0025427694|nr:hypothetical protein [Chondrinema litorale]UZR97561.1 hypothetical protein OQ292_26420 [Chondrinema litorale]
MKLIGFVLLLSCVEYGYCQEIDSIKVIFTDAGNGGEKYKMLYKGNEILNVKSTKSGHGFYIFKIRREVGSNYLPFELFRKSRFGLSYRDCDVDIENNPDMTCLTIGRDNRLKNKYCFTYFWSDSDHCKYRKQNMYINLP